MIKKLISFKQKDWEYFCSKINFGASFLDADAIRIMNEPISGISVEEHNQQLISLIKDIKDILNECECEFDECPECNKNNFAYYVIGLIKQLSEEEE